MKIESYIQETLRTRVAKTSCLVVYDEDKRYRALALSLADDSTQVIDASDSLVLGREEALESWARLGETPGARLVIYIPWAKPKDEQGWRNDAFAPFVLGGSVFPDGDADSYRELCLQAFPARLDEVKRLFVSGIPSFEVIDGLSGGALWPALRALLGVESEREMLLALVAPSAKVQERLLAGGTWGEELKRFLKASLGFELQTSNIVDLQESLGRYLLFSEFVEDIGLPLPTSMSEVPRASSERRGLVFSLCDALRDSASTRPLYRELAEKVEATFAFANKFPDSAPLGSRGTFAFQNQAALAACLALAKGADYPLAFALCQKEESSVWFEASDSIRSLWTCSAAAVKLLDGVSAFEALAQSHQSVEACVRAYIDRFSALDAAYRDLEAFVADMDSSQESGDPVLSLVDLARDAYFRAAEKLHRELIRAVDKESWLSAASADQASVFKNNVVPLLGTREKVAYFMIDALRLDLARELISNLPPAYTSRLETVRGKLPSITPVGMAAILPGAESRFSVQVEAEGIVPTIDSTKVGSAQERVAYLKSVYGDRVRDTPMSELEALKKADIGEQVDLLVVRSTDIDDAGESLGAQALPMLSRLLRSLLRSLERARKLGFAKAIIATDHGFLLLPPAGAGGVAEKPKGSWELQKPRFLLGEGDRSTAGAFLAEAISVGVPTYPKKFATPAGLGSFVAGLRYVHGGLSLQECVLPVVTIDFPSQAPKKREFGVSLGYKGGMTNKIMTMRPSLDLSVSNPDGEGLFGGELEAEVSLIVLVKASGAEVGRVQASAGYDPGAGAFRLKPGKSIKITLAMDDEFRGAFTVSALDPLTLELFAKLELQTEYTE
jgi:hypothetical protein